MEQPNFKSGPPTERSVVEQRLAEIFKKIGSEPVFKQLAEEILLQKD